MLAPESRGAVTANERDAATSPATRIVCTKGRRSARAVASARAQTEAIRGLARAGRLAGLPAPLREAATARLRAPTATLNDLARRLDTTKWVVRSRLRRLVAEGEA